MTDCKQIKGLELKELINQGAYLVDIHREDEWRTTGVVAESLLLTFFDPAGNADPAVWVQQLDLLVPIDKPLALICRSGYRTELVSIFFAKPQAEQKFIMSPVVFSIGFLPDCQLKLIQIGDSLFVLRANYL